MKKQFITIILLIISITVESQSAKDIFTFSNVPVSWLGIDFSHVKLIGEFSQIYGAGEQSDIQIRDKYFPAWNKLILNEPDKYDLKGMLNKDTVIYDIDMLMKINSSTPLENMESYSSPNYTEEDIKNFLSSYNTEGKKGMGVLFLAESLNKIAKEAYFHFIVIDLKTKELLFHERLRGVPKGFGIRNYWAGSIYRIIKQIKTEH